MLLYCIYIMGLIDFLFPKFCLGCGFVGAYICRSCFKKLKSLDRSRCLYCKRESYLGLTHPGCLQKLYIDGTLSFFHYNYLMKRIVKNIKYRLATGVFEELSLNLKPSYLEKLFSMKKLLIGASIQPIPLTEKKLKSRGFNQAQLVAEFFNSVLGLETGNFLARVADNFPQAALSTGLARYKNIRGVFKLRPGQNIKNKKIVLVDDVVTTGATVGEAAKVLKQAGASKVYVLSLAQG